MVAVTTAAAGGRVTVVAAGGVGASCVTTVLPHSSPSASPCVLYQVHIVSLPFTACAFSALLLVIAIRYWFCLCGNYLLHLTT